MKPLTREWIEKAEGDFATASREMRARKFPNYDAACFHAQQCVEKYFKALLQEFAIPFGKTHHLISLLELIIAVEPSMEMFRPQLQSLNTYSVSIRYPGESADRVIAREALGIAKTLRTQFRQKFSLNP
jgi:HEPN domain-containing protein